jgi:ferredoxin/flavodoxin---NADP+ reductase
LEHLHKVNFAVAGVELNEIDASTANADPILQRKMATLRKLVSRPHEPGNKRIGFLRSPVEAQGAVRVERMVTACNSLEIDSSGKQVLRSTGETDAIETGLVFRAVGYRGTAFPGLPFDDRLGVIRNNRGRVTNDTDNLPGVYTTGWIKRGCNGIIGSNRKCANETVRHLLEDLSAGRLSTATLGRSQVKHMLLRRVPRAVSLAQWIGIDHAERSAGRATGRPRVKITSRDGLLSAARVQ